VYLKPIFVVVDEALPKQNHAMRLHTRMTNIPLVLTLGMASIAGGAAPEADLAGFSAKVQPFLDTYCMDCHDEGTSKGNFSLEEVDPGLVRGDHLETWRMVFEQVHFKEMPPKKKKQPTEMEKKAVLDWIRKEQLKGQMPGVTTQEKLLLPQFGNYIDHQALFGRRLKRVYPAPPRIWRLRSSIYQRVAPSLSPGERIDGLANGLGMNDGSEFKDYAAGYFIDEASTAPLLGNAKKVAMALLGPRSRDKVFKQLVGDAPPDGETVDAATELAFQRMLGRKPVPEEQIRFKAFYEKAKKTGGYRPAAKALLSAVIMQPEFLFRSELGDGDPDEHGRLRLSQAEIAYALSYALDNHPVREFLEAAQAGKLATREQVAEQVRARLVDESELYMKNPRIIQFFREYFHYPFSNVVFKDNPPHVSYNPDMLVQDLEITIKEILKQDREVLKKLLTTRDYHVGVKWVEDKEHRGRRKLDRAHSKMTHYATYYGLPMDWKWSRDIQPVSFPRDERAGILTHPAWLTAWSGNFENHPVQRGKWIRTRLLGGSVPDVPIGVDARVPEMEHTTFRDRLKMATEPAECWRCHKKMDPIGLAFEFYDHYGRPQRWDVGQPVDPSSRIDRTLVPGLHRSFSKPTEMMDFLAESKFVEQVFVRHVFRYFMGRNETLGDANTLQDAWQAYRSSGGSFNALVTSILSSDSFLLRAKPEV
jgi:hypothetical protein